MGALVFGFMFSLPKITRATDTTLFLMFYVIKAYYAYVKNPMTSQRLMHAGDMYSNRKQPIKSIKLGLTVLVLILSNFHETKFNLCIIYGHIASCFKQN